MITVQVRGGLGNQMFQYATGRAAALRCRTELALDLRWFARSPAYGFQLQRYPIQAARASVRQTRMAPPPIPSRLGTARSRVLDRLGLGPTVLDEAGSGIDHGPYGVQDGVYLVGYWQSERYFDDVADVIRGELTLDTPLDGENERVADVIQSTASVSVHVRRGDYVGSATHPVCSPAYYESAIAELRGRMAQPHFFVFSDDTEWCRRHLAGRDLTIVDHNGPGSEHEDLRLMSLCQAHVIANSSFSWWGAWLGDGPTIAPEHWFADGQDSSAIVPARWQRR